MFFDSSKFMVLDSLIINREGVSKLTFSNFVRMHVWYVMNANGC